MGNILIFMIVFNIFLIHLPNVDTSLKTIQWDKDKNGKAKYYYRTFETQRPVS